MLQDPGKVGTLEAIAKTRWLKTQEIHYLLHHIEELLLSGFQLKTAPHLARP
jgi:hypothetical protein